MAPIVRTDLDLLDRQPPLPPLVYRKIWEQTTVDVSPTTRLRDLFERLQRLKPGTPTHRRTEQAYLLLLGARWAQYQ